MKIYMSLWVVVLSGVLTACGGEENAREVSPRVVNYTPELRRFDLVDSYGVDTAENTVTSLNLDPFLDNGLFDVFWSVNSLEDYRVNFRINDTTGISNSLLVYSEICGEGLACDQSGGVICEYTQDFYLSCNNSNHPTDIAVLFSQAPPQKLYVQLEICDLNSDYCEYDYHPVWMQ
jgi:hypothetical protein